MSLLAEIFGINGSAAEFFGGQWWLAGIFLIFVFTVYLYGRGFTQEAMGLFIFSAFILLTIDGLFQIPIDWIIMIVVFITMLIGLGVKQFLTR